MIIVLAAIRSAFSLSWLLLSEPNTYRPPPNAADVRANGADVRAKQVSHQLILDLKTVAVLPLSLS
jgi:hypothetical protein